MHGILSILFITLNFMSLSYAGKVMKCPSVPEWNHRAQEYCLLDPEKYHCLQLQGSDGYIELCKPAIRIPMGNYARWSEAAQEIYKVPCPKERYQEVPTSSNKQYQCEKEKSICNEEGELTYRDGDTVTDRSCRCDYKSGYTASIYAFRNPLNRTYYFPKQVHRGCQKFNDCKQDEELNPAYRCVKKCQKGYYRPELEFHCVHNPSATSPKTTTTESIRPTPPPTTSTLPSKPVTGIPPNVGDLQDTEYRTSVKIVVGLGVFVGMLLLTLLLGFLWMKSLHAFIPEFETRAEYDKEYTLHCNIYNTCVPGKLTCEWSKIDDYDNRHLIEAGDLYRISSKQKQNKDKSITVSVLTIKKVNEETEGSYECKVWNLGRHSVAETHVHVAGGGPIEETPKGEKRAIYPDESSRWKHVDSGTEMSTPNTPLMKRPFIYIKNYHEGPTTNIEYSENTVIGPKGKIQHSVSYSKVPRSSKDREDGSTSSEEPERTPRPRGKRRKSNKSRSPMKSSSDGGDTSDDANDSLLPRDKQVIRTQNDSLSEYKRCMQLLDDFAKEKYKLKVVDVVGDGSCLYHAVLHQLDSGSVDKNNANALRKALIKFFESNPSMPDGTDYQDFLCLPLDSDRGRIQPEDMYIEKNVCDENNQKALRWQRFLKRIQEGEWGGDLEIMGIAQHCQIQICVLCLNPKMDDLMEFSFNSESRNGKEKIYIGHIRVQNRGYHFVAMCPLEERKRKDKDPILVKIESTHYALIDKIAQTIYHGSEPLSRLKTLLIPHLEPVHRQDKVTFPDLCASLLEEELIQIGEYKFLKEKLKSIDHDGLVHFFETAEEEIQEIKENNGLEQKGLDEDTGFDVKETYNDKICDPKEIRMDNGKDATLDKDTSFDVQVKETSSEENCNPKEIQADNDKDACVDEKNVDVRETGDAHVRDNGEIKEMNGLGLNSSDDQGTETAEKCKNNDGMGDATENHGSLHINS